MIAKYTAPGLTKWLLARIIAAGDSDAVAEQPQQTVSASQIKP
jgi:hypothetical protein